MSFAEHKPHAARPTAGVGVSIVRSGVALKVHISIGADAAAALGVAGGDRVAVLIGTGTDAGSLRLKRVDRGGRKLARYNLERSGDAACLKLVTAPWPGLPDRTQRMERRAFTRVGPGEIELVLPDWDSPGVGRRPGATEKTRPEPAPASPKAAPRESTLPPKASPKTPAKTPAKPARRTPATAPKAITRVGEVAGLVKDGLSPAAIAARLEIELNTVGYYTYAARKERLLPPAKRGGKAGAPARSRIAPVPPKASRRSPFEALDADPSSGVGSPGVGMAGRDQPHARRPDEEDDPSDVTAELTGDLEEGSPRE